MNNFNIIPRLVDYSSDEEQCDAFRAEKIAGKDYLEINAENTIETCESSLTNECGVLPLPSEIRSMYSDYSTDVATDDPEKYGGKIRSFPHERGVWATYVYIEYVPTSEFLKMLEDVKNLSKKYGIILSSVEDLHVSLSRTLKLRHHWIQPFTESLRAHLGHLFKFKIMFQSLEVYENEEKTRTFLGLKVHFGFDNLLKITQKVDECLSEFKLPSFYDNPSFHLSCVSCVGSKAEDIQLFMSDLNDVFQSFAESHISCRTLWVKNICCKSGNRYFTIPLKS